MQGYELLTAASVSPALLQQLEDGGMTVKVVPTGLKVVKDGEVVGSLPLAAQTLESLKLGVASTLTKAAIQDSLASVVSVVSAGGSNSPLHDKIELKPIKLGGSPTPSQAAASKPVPVAVNLTAPTVKLASATSIYQAVSGTDGGSRYFCVGLSPNLNMAARWLGKNLSIRFEGNLNIWAPTLTAAGLKISEKHASLHLTDITDLQVQKAVGGLLMAIPAGWVNPVPDVQQIKGHGA